MIEIIPGKGSGQLKKRVLRFLDQKEIKAKYHRIEKDSRISAASSCISAGNSLCIMGSAARKWLVILRVETFSAVVAQGLTVARLGVVALCRPASDMRRRWLER